MIDYYDKEGNPLTQEAAWALMEDLDYRRVASTDVGPYWVSTVWLCINHNWFGEGPPILFETMVFSKDQRDDPEDHSLAEFDCIRYCTEEQALAGHEEMCTLVRATIQEEIPTQEHENGNK